MLTEVFVPERGSTVVDSATWGELGSSPELWKLVDRKIIKVSSLRGGTAMISAGGSVGFARCGKVFLSIQEKIPGALAALLFGEYGAVRTIDVAGVFSRHTEFFDSIVREMLVKIRDYVGGGREWEYRRVRQRGSIAGGRLLEIESALLRRSGFPHLLEFESMRISHDVELNRCIAAALLTTESYASSGLLSKQTIVESRALATFFYANFTADVLVSSPEQMARRIDALIQWKSGKTVEMLEFARIVLTGGGMSPLGSAAGDLSWTWFFNLEHAFEKAVRCAVSRRFSGSMEVFKGSDGTYLFPRQRRLAVDPDIIIRGHEELDATVVADVKYKSLKSGPSASDVYQLLAHTAALGSRSAVLIYPAEEYLSSLMGVTISNVSLEVLCGHPAELHRVADRIYHSVFDAH